MRIDLDYTNTATIRALQLDGRTPYSKLGPAVGLSQAAVRQRVQRLIDKGVMQVVAVTDPATLKRIEDLVIPPAWKKVWICPHPNGHIQAVGTDVAGRLQGWGVMERHDALW